MRYWETAGATKTFTHPVDLSRLPGSGRIIDYGCGYGRLTARAGAEGYDPSAALIERARLAHPGVPFHVLTDPPRLPLADATVDAVLLVAVLTCVPAEADQRDLIAELARVLRPGVLYVSDLPLQTDGRNVARYRRDAGVLGPYGTFRTSDGAVVRHHPSGYLEALVLSHFATAESWAVEVETMNAHPATARQILARKEEQ
ncbi:class I SAM-dependent methyltransferase [Actinoplanes sp. NPDC049596]|uniref:class I SAM-dependent methyltransferase n=1 Tax=unclassified Actinoplanes TaxID=2626549 RepID=UPI00343237F8